MPLYDIENRVTGEVREDVYLPLFRYDDQGNKLEVDHQVEIGPDWFKRASRLGVVVEHAVPPTQGHRVIAGLHQQECELGSRYRTSGEFTRDQYFDAWSDDLAKKVKT